MAAEVKKLKKQKPKEQRFLYCIYARAAAFIRAHVFIKEENENSRAAERRYVVLCIRALLGCVFCSLMSGTQLAFSMYPLGLAFLSSAGRALPLYTASALLSGLRLGGMSGIYCVAAVLILLSRTVACVYLDAREEGVTRFPLYNEWASCRVVVSCIAAFCVGIYNLFYGNFSYYSLLGSLLIMAVTPISCYIFMYSFAPSGRAEHRDAARLFVCAVLVWSLADIRVIGVCLGDVAAFFLIVSEAAKGKKAAAALMGLAAGIPFGLSSAAVYALSGVLCSLLCSLSSALGCMGAFTFTVMAQGYIGGYAALVSALPGASVGLCVSLLWFRYGIYEKISCFGRGMLRQKEDDSAKTETDAPPETQSIERLSESFSSMSSMLKSLCAYGERNRILDVRSIVEECCDGVCRDCKARSLCWGERATDTADAYSKLTGVLAGQRKITNLTLPRYLRDNCIKQETLILGLNRKMSEAAQKAIRHTGCRLLACDYEAMSRILDSHIERTKETCALDRDLSLALTQLCRRRLYGISSVSVWGKRIKKLYACGIDLSSHTVSAAELRREFSRVSRCALSSPVYSIDGTDVEFEMHSQPIVKMKCAIASLPKEGEGECGDTARTVENDEGYVYCVLCDGMGSGTEAAYTSGICTEYLSSMLEHSNPKELTVQMLNAVLREQMGECSSTVDLFELDTYTGQGCFIKSGAAPSFVCRDKNVYRVAARTIPIGITEHIKAEKIKFRLREGDIVVMVSDGVVEGPEEGRLVVEALCRRTTSDPFDIAAALLSEAKTKYNCRDDMTVAVMTVGAAQQE